MAKTAFDPKVHGYQFQNIAASAWGNVGVCGGMSWSAVDFFFHPSQTIPGYDNASFPNGVLVKGWQSSPTDSLLADYIWKRQMDSVNANGGGFLLALTQPPKSNQNFAKLKQFLDAGIPTPIALPSMGANVFEGHHVVAIDYDEAGGNKDIKVYDPNCPNETCVLRIVRDDKLVETDAGGTQIGEWKGFWIADGFVPEVTPAGLEDIVLTAISAPSVADSVTSFDVTFSIANVGEFETLVHSVGLKIDGGVLNQKIQIPGGRLPLSHTYAAGPFTMTLPAGPHTLEPIYYTTKNSGHRSLETSRKVIVTQGWPKDSWIQLGGLEGKQRVSSVLGKLLSGPTIFKPYVPFEYEVKEYKVGLKVWVEDAYGGGSFADPMASVTATLDAGTLRSISVKIVGPETATYEAAYDPVPGQESTVLRVVATDHAGNKYERALAVPCSTREVVPRIDLNHTIPDLHHDPFGRPPFGVLPQPTPRPPLGVIRPIDPRVRIPRR